MEDSMAHGSAVAAPAALDGWKLWVGTLSAVLLALLFVVAGIWKLSDPISTEARMVQALVPPGLAMAVALAAGIAETWAGVLLLVPRWRKWGAWLSGLMLVAFMVYFAVFYNRLQGADCSCFPWLKRVVGPGFFISDGLMLALAVAAGAWSSKADSWKHALLALGAITVSAGVLYGVSLTQQTGVKSPDQIMVDGKAHSLRQGRTFVYFFDPECMHCFAGAKGLAGLKWKDVKVVAVPTVNPHWALGFLRDTGLRAGVSFDVKLLRESFKFTDPPYGVAIENGRQAQAFTFFDEKEPVSGLKALGWAE
jgi:uncharacterized membrane protein YphA (DoxX/SURF4 family)